MLVSAISNDDVGDDVVGDDVVGDDVRDFLEVDS